MPKKKPRPTTAATILPRLRKLATTTRATQVSLPVPWLVALLDLAESKATPPPADDPPTDAPAST